MKTAQLETTSPPVSTPTLRRGAPNARLNAGALVAQRELATISGETISLPDPERYVHLQFRRFAGCPICDLHLRSFVQRNETVVKAEIREVVVFHSALKELKDHASDLPFAVIADPHKQLYDEFGVGTS